MPGRIANVKWYDEQRRRGGARGRVGIAALRVADLSRLYRARYGETLPDDDAGRDDAAIMVQHIASQPGDPRRRVMAWLESRAPWMAIAEAKALLVDAIANPRRWRADKLAWRLRLTSAERAALRITTIGAVDRGKGTRDAQRRTRNRDAKERERRAKGAQPRHAYEATSAQRLKPWAALGMSRATWFRRGKPPPPPPPPPPP